MGVFSGDECQTGWGKPPARAMLWASYNERHLALTVLSILVGWMVVHGVGWRGVGRWAVRLGARQGGHTGQAW